MPLRQRLPALIVGFVALAGIVWGAIALLPSDGGSILSQPANDSSGLRIENVELIEGGEGQAQRVEYDLHWRGAVFPGAYECSWQVLDASGNQIGLVEDEVMSLRPSAIGVSVEVPVEGEGASAAAECGAQRLDAGGTYGYEFTLGEVVVSQRGQLALGFHSAWQGEGSPGAVTCRATVMDETSQVIATIQVNIAGEASGDSAIYLSANGVTEDDSGFTGTIEDCRPFVAP